MEAAEEKSKEMAKYVKISDFSKDTLENSFFDLRIAHIGKCLQLNNEKLHYKWKNNDFFSSQETNDK